MKPFYNGTKDLRLHIFLSFFCIINHSAKAKQIFNFLMFTLLVHENS